MTFNRRGVARLTFCITAAGALTLAAPSLPGLDRLFSERTRDDSRSSAATTHDPLAWRSRQGSIEEALRDFLNGGAKAPAREDKVAGLFRHDGPATPLTAYAPADKWLAQTAAPDPAPIDSAALLGADLEAFSRALSAYKANDFAAGDTAAATLQASLPLTAAQWAGLRLHPREAGFARLSRFLAEHPSWPAADWLRRRAEESLFGDRHPDKLVKDYFADSKPLTPAGKLALARTLARDGDFIGAGALAKDVWREDDINESLESAVKKDFSDLLTTADHKYRADRLLYAEKNGAALRAADLAGKDVALLARARAAANNDNGNEKLFSSVPPTMQNDPGLLFARVHTLRKSEKFAEAAALLRTAPREPERVIDGDAWWTERRLVARKMLDQGDAATAYVICAQHAARTLNSKVEAEFHAGWIALRFLDDAVNADRHFGLLARIAETPHQKSRAAYWRGRVAETYQTSEDSARARALFEEAGRHSTTFYGQLARAKIGLADSPLRAPPVASEGDARDESVRAVELLFAAGEKELASPLAIEAAKRMENGAHVAALGHVLTRQRDAKTALVFGKQAAYRGVALDDVAFPSYGVPQFDTLPGSASRSIVYAIARQESAFDPRAVSSAGALGLMQMIPSTARRTAFLTRVGFDLSRMLSEPAFNAQLGAAHVGILMGEHKGSYLLTFAAYNAGGGNVSKWIHAYGDPRRPDVDPVDWMERIPFSETRNYVQRVMENFVVYRAKFGDSDTRAPQVELARASSGAM